MNLSILLTNFLLAVNNAMLVAPNDSTRTAINCVAFDIEDDHLRVVATDMYRLIIHDIPKVEFTGMPFSISYGDMSRVISVIKTFPKNDHKFYTVDIVNNPDDKSIIIHLGGPGMRDIDISCEAQGKEFPPYRQLTSQGGESEVRAGFHPKFLADIGKIVDPENIPAHRDSTRTAAVLTFYGPSKPARWTIGPSVQYWLMPVRVS